MWVRRTCDDSAFHTDYASCLWHAAMSRRGVQVAADSDALSSAGGIWTMSYQ